MKVVFEFTDEERSQAEDAFRGTEYRAALYRTKFLFEDKIKKGSLTTAQRTAVMSVYKLFLEITADLPLE